jgi:hypothetical protein
MRYSENTSCRSVHAGRMLCYYSEFYLKFGAGEPLTYSLFYAVCSVQRTCLQENGTSVAALLDKLKKF